MLILKITKSHGGIEHDGEHPINPTLKVTFCLQDNKVYLGLTHHHFS